MSDEMKVTDWMAFGYHGYKEYRVWFRLTDHGNFQRHEWKREDGTAEVQDWIPCGVQMANLMSVKEADAKAIEAEKK